MPAGKKRAYIILAVINCICLIIFAVMTFARLSVSRSLPSQLAAERWNAGGSQRVSQVSVFYARSLLKDINSVYKARTDIEKKLTEYSIKPEKDGARTWIDAYSAGGTMTVSSEGMERTVSVEAAATAVGGDYFLFHPLKIISGYYFSPADSSRDRVLLDENLAWQLFGSGNIDGMTVLINNKRFYIAGVVEAEQKGKASKYTYGEKPRIYVSYDGIGDILEIKPAITCYEAVLPDPVTGIALKTIEETATEKDTDHKLIENSARFSNKNLFEIAFDGGKRLVDDSEVYYPFWENAARMTEEKAASLFAFSLYSLIIPVLSVLFLLHTLIKNRKKLFNLAKEKIKTLAFNIRKN